MQALGPRSISGFLVMNQRGDLRVTKNRPRLRLTEFALRVTVTTPPSFWGSVVGQINAELPTDETPPSIDVRFEEQAYG